MSSKHDDIEARTTNILINGKWEERKFDEITVGDSFMLFEPDGSAVVDLLGCNVFEATGAPYRNTSNKVFEIKCDGIGKFKRTKDASKKESSKKEN